MYVCTYVCVLNRVVGTFSFTVFLNAKRWSLASMPYTCSSKLQLFSPVLSTIICQLTRWCSHCRQRPLHRDGGTDCSTARYAPCSVTAHTYIYKCTSQCTECGRGVCACVCCMQRLFCCTCVCVYFCLSLYTIHHKCLTWMFPQACRIAQNAECQVVSSYAHSVDCSHGILSKRKHLRGSGHLL